MSPIDYTNLYFIVEKCRGFLRDDYVQTMEAALDEISRLQGVVKQLQKEKRQLKATV